MFIVVGIVEVDTVTSDNGAKVSNLRHFVVVVGQV